VDTSIADMYFMSFLGRQWLERSVQAVSEDTKKIMDILFLCIKSHLHDAQTSKTAVGFLKIGTLSVSHSIVQI
jgi:hypothetical protein